MFINLKKNYQHFLIFALIEGVKFFLENSGNSKFVCPYHSWTYDYTGKVKTIPFEKRAFEFKNRERAKIKLEKWELEYCGEFIFFEIKKK